MIITKRQYDRICRLRDGEHAVIPVDFGLTQTAVTVKGSTVLFSHGAKIPLPARIKDTFCYLVKRRDLVPCAFYAENTRRFYKLIPTRNWPSIAIGSVPMHAVTRSSPAEDTRRKLTLLKPRGKVLDTCMGLGYTAMGAARAGCDVYTFERDSNVITLARLNPLSGDLFTRKNIHRRKADIYEYIRRFGPGEFDCIIHDPPTVRIAPELFSDVFYRQLYRVLKKRGRLYHYLPLYRIRQGRDYPAKIKGKLKQAGFEMITFLPREGNLLCRT